MFSEYKVGKWYFYFIAGPFIVTQLIILGFIWYLLLNQNWFESGTDKKIYFTYNYNCDNDYEYNCDEEYYFDGNSFKGDIWGCNSGCGQAYSYSQMSYMACGSFYSFDDLPNELKSICKTFKDLDDWVIYKRIIDNILMIQSFFWIAIVSCNLKHCFCFKIKYFCILVSAGSYIAASTILFLRGPVTFGNCDSFPSNGDRLMLCVGYPAKLTIVLMAVFGLLAIVFIIVGCIAEKNRALLKLQELRSLANKTNYSSLAPNSLESDNEGESDNPFIGEPDLKDRPIPQDMIDLCRRILK